MPQICRKHHTLLILLLSGEVGEKEGDVGRYQTYSKICSELFCHLDDEVFANILIELTTNSFVTTK